MDRPAFPPRNPLLLSHTGKQHSVKLQTLALSDTNSITIARVKLLVPKGISGHLIKRFDTNAVSASTLYRASFPTATVEQEDAEMRWLESTAAFGDTALAGNEADIKHKLTGTWIPVEEALRLAKEYGVERFVVGLVEFELPVQEEEVEEPVVEQPKLVVPEGKSPRAKRQRKLSPAPPALATPTKSTRSSAASATTRSARKLVVNPPVFEPEEDEVEEDEAPTMIEDESNGLVASNEAIEQELAKARALVSELAAAAAVASVTTKVKRALSPVVAEEQESSSWFFPRRRRAAPVVAAIVVEEREIKPFVSQIAMVERQRAGEGRRWIAGLGIVVALGATAAVPYILG